MQINATDTRIQNFYENLVSDGKPKDDNNTDPKQGRDKNGWVVEITHGWSFRHLKSYLLTLKGFFTQVKDISSLVCGLGGKPPSASCMKPCQRT